MDAVITYVNGLDPIWQKTYSELTDKPVLCKRFRDWGTLKYLLRGIETKMPFIENVYLVVSSESQVPEWADREHLKIILHEDIIPHEYLPTFNSTTIEIFLYRIPGLDEKFIYFNDDMFPIMDCRTSDFFQGEKIVMGFSHHLLKLNMYKKQCCNSDAVIRGILKLPSSPAFIRPQHTPTPMFRSACEQVYKEAGEKIEQSLSPLRNSRNLNQYLYPDFLFRKGRAVNIKLSNKHISVAATTSEKIERFLRRPDRKFTCINDVKIKESKFIRMQAAILSSFETLFPEKSRFEK